MADICRHPKLNFMSGDYYVGCPSCHMVWMLKGDFPEYGTDKDGNRIGADPDKRQAGFIDYDAPRSAVPARLDEGTRRALTPEEDRLMLKALVNSSKFVADI